MKTAGMILAAGLGTRMGDLSSIIPKPLLPVLGVPMLSLICRKLRREGAGGLHANTHHLSGMIEEAVRRDGLGLVLHEEEDLLDTGGGIGNMAAGMDADVVLLHNGDVISSAGYAGALEAHLASGALMTMILMPPGEGAPPPHVLVGDDGFVSGFDASPPAGGVLPRRLGYTGMALISREGLGRFPAGRAYPLTGFLEELISDNPRSVKGFELPVGPGAHRWAETGSPSAYLMLHRRIMTGRESFDPLLPPPPIPLLAEEGARVEPGACWQGFLYVGRNSLIMDETVLEDCVVMEDTVVERGTRASRAILARDRIIEGET